MSDASPEPFSPQNLASIARHPQFPTAVRAWARDSLAGFAGLDPIGRWLRSDLGRTALSATTLALAAEGRLTSRALEVQAAKTGVASRGRVRTFIERARAYLLLAPIATDAGLDTPLGVSEGYIRRMTDHLPIVLASAALVFPELAAAAARSNDLGFRLRVSAWVAALMVARPHLFPIADTPVRQLQAHDGGMRVLEAWIAAQPAHAPFLLGPCVLSRAALARASFCSRTHIRRLLTGAHTQGLLAIEGDQLTAAPALCADVERYYALLFVTMREAACATL
ncbi:MAG TPA: hypothetical protein VG248_15585 [Caulobacteraceae bacterium]|nr:hypothetical protein [Caulobacteraceae bacterium]